MAAPDQRETSEDALLGGRIVIRQPRRGARVAVDSLLLAAALTARAEDRLLELGAGVGAVSLCAAERLKAGRFVGLEREPWLRQLAEENAARNHLRARCRFFTGDVSAPPPAVMEEAPFQTVFFNPPFHAAGRADAPPDPLRRRAFVEELGALSAWIGCAFGLLQAKGRLVLIHRADRLDEIIAALSPRRRFGDIRILPILPRAHGPASRVIVWARKGVRGGTEIAAPLVLHEDDGRFTPAAERLLREGTGLLDPDQSG